LDIGYWILDIGYWILDIGYWILDIGYWILRTFNGGIYLDNYFRYRGEPAFGGSFYPGFDKIRFKSP
jgi:hypothetical protein